LKEDKEYEKIQVTYKHMLVCNTVFNIAQCLHRVLEQKAWILLFETLQKVSCLIYKAEYKRNSTTPNIFHLNVIGSRILENIRKFGIPNTSNSHANEEKEEVEKLEIPEIEIPRRPVAGTGGEEDSHKNKEECENVHGTFKIIKKSRTSDSMRLSSKDVVGAIQEMENFSEDKNKLSKRSSSIIYNIKDEHNSSIFFRINNIYRSTYGSIK